MKKFVFLALFAASAIGTAFTQGWGGGSQPITVNGTLQLRNGQIAVADENNAYFVPALERYIGFIDSLKEGTRVSVEGYAWGNYLKPSKVIIGGKSYDFNSYSWGPGGYGYSPMCGRPGSRSGCRRGW